MRANNEIRITTIIGKGAECNGDFDAQGSVRLDGVIHGNVTVSETLVIGAAGYVEGDIIAQTAIVGGEVNGNIKAPVKTELTSSGRVIGDITTGSIIIDEHAIFQGRCDMNQEAGKRGKMNMRALKAGKRSAKAAIEEALKEVEAASREDSAGESAGGEGGSLLGGV
ncbi:MAG: polymer-forming cytoskeletal protein [Roseburia sp.]|nr:polymer-forming cytoskeletal protein [Roseburia sp.]MCM1098546.1 polymer-forming cytoskeletal protein [Ruminococcus flavefaciens]